MARGLPEHDTEKGSRFYAAIAISVLAGIGFDLSGINAVKMLFWSAILNGLLAPLLVVMIVLLTSDRKVMGDKTNSGRCPSWGGCGP